MCAFWKPVQTEQKITQNAFGDGINTGVPSFEIADNETMYSRNMDSWNYPAASARPGRNTAAGALDTTSITNGLGQRNNDDLHAVSERVWEYWDFSSSAFTVLTTSLSAGNTQANIQEFNTADDRYTILMNSTQKYYWLGSGTTILNLGTTDTPNSSIFTIHKGRIYIAKRDYIKFCALNLPNDWTTANDAGTIVITHGKGDITGLVEYNDHVIAFTEYSMHELYGTGPSNYNLVDVEGEIGCISDRSITKVGNRLYWMWHDGIYQYNGSVPRKISEPVREYIKNIDMTRKTYIVGASWGDYLYFSIPYGTTTVRNNLILKYDTRLNLWFIEEGEFVDFVTIGNILYGVDKFGVIWNMRNETLNMDSSQNIAWEFITKPFTEQSLEGKKTITDMYLLADIDANSTSFVVGYSTNSSNNDSSSFTTLAELTNSSNTSSDPYLTRMQVPFNQLQNIDWYRLRFSGSNHATIHSLQKNMRIKRR
jgi:hypothetical protein